MKLLINLAQIDGTVAEREKNFIINIGRANGIYPDEITPMFERRNELSIPLHLSDDEKFNYMLSLVQLMKIDERMYKEEILFCTTVASGLGYSKEVMSDLVLHATHEMDEDDIQVLRKLTERHLKRQQ